MGSPCANASSQHRYHVQDPGENRAHHLLAAMVVETHPVQLRKWSLRTLVEIAREEGEGRRRQRLAALLAGPRGARKAGA
jgi:hypothetical protein